jgi:hypothetical protein
LRLNWRFLATHRPESSKNVQPLCSQSCSQSALHPSAERRSSHEPRRPDFTWMPFQGAGQRRCNNIWTHKIAQEQIEHCCPLLSANPGRRTLSGS